MKNLKALSKKDLRKIQGGQAPLCCISWNPILKECRKWNDNCLNP